MGTDFLHLLRQHKQTDDSCHLEGQRQQIHENISTWKLSSKALTVLTWKYEAGPSLSQNSGKKPGHYEVTSAVAVPAPQALQRFKKAAHHHILKLWLDPKIPVEAFLMHVELACQFLLGDSAFPCVMKIRKDRRLSALDCRGVARLDGNTAVRPHALSGGRVIRIRRFHRRGLCSIPSQASCFPFPKQRNFIPKRNLACQL